MRAWREGVRKARREGRKELRGARAQSGRGEGAVGLVGRRCGVEGQIMLVTAYVTAMEREEGVSYDRVQDAGDQEGNEDGLFASLRLVF